MVQPTPLRLRVLVAALAALPVVACGGAGGSGGASTLVEPSAMTPEALLLRVAPDEDLAAVEADAAADGWTLARTYQMPAADGGAGSVLCVLESVAGAAVRHPADCGPFRIEKRIEKPKEGKSGKDGKKSKDGKWGKTSSSSSEKVSPMRCGRAFGGDQSYVPIFDDDVNFLAYAKQSALHTIGATDPRLTQAGAGVKVAVLDGGFHLGHEAVAGRIAAGGYDAISDDDDPSDGGDDVDGDRDGVVDGFVGHGTAVAGLVLAVAPRAFVVPIRVLDDEGLGTTATVAAGLIAAIDAGAKIINLSAHANHSSDVITELVALARSKGILVVASAGNSGQNQVGYPASLSDAVALGGATAGLYDAVADYGPEIDVSAPVRDLIAPFPGTTDGYGRWSGTSMSAALYSGAVAAGLSLAPGTTAMLVSDALLAKPTPYLVVPSNLKNRVGRGVLNVASLLP